MARPKVEISVRSEFVARQSDPARGVYLYAYTVTIRNTGDIGCQLLSRHWEITDGTGRVREVRGEGVVGQQPSLAPGDEFTYTSACPLPTSVGSMRGRYQLVSATGEHFDAEIPQFSLARPEFLN